MTRWPAEFKAQMQKLLNEKTEAFFAAQAQPAPVSLRMNPSKLRISSAQDNLHQVPWSQTGLYLSERPVFTLDPRFHAGGYYVQDASCMLLEAIYLQLPFKTEALKVLDLCAAPGGKSTHLASLISREAWLIANEVVPARARILAENIAKWGAENVFVSQNQAKDFQKLPFQFDLILADAPCSGEGLFRRQTEALEEWSPAQVLQCATRQDQILEEIWPCLKPGGLLIYSTCTWNSSENEMLLQAFQLKHDFENLEMHFPPEWGIDCSKEMPLYRCYPHRLEGEGFSFSVLRKPESTPPHSHPPKELKRQQAKKSEAPVNRVHLAQVTEWVQAAEAQDFITEKEQIWYLPSRFAHEFQELNKALKLLSKGIFSAEIKGKDLIPAAPLALYPGLRSTNFQIRELSLEEAIACLSREALPGQGKGWHLFCYQGLALGWAKATATHFNNAWPKEWKIRQRFANIQLEENLSHLPDFQSIRT